MHRQSIRTWLIGVTILLSVGVGMLLLQPFSAPVTAEHQCKVNWTGMTAEQRAACAQEATATAVQHIMAQQTAGARNETPTAKPQPPTPPRSTPLALDAVPTVFVQECGQEWVKWHDTAREKFLHCTRLKATMVAIQEVHEQQTAAIPRPLASPVVPDGTPLARGFIPERARKIEALAREDLIGGAPIFTKSSSVWHNGAVLAPSQDDYYEVYLWSGPGCILGSLMTDPEAPQGLIQQYNRTWECPRDIGDIIITAAMGPDGIVSFANTAGQTGTFDLQTQKWTFSP